MSWNSNKEDGHHLLESWTLSLHFLGSSPVTLKTSYIKSPLDPCHTCFSDSSGGRQLTFHCQTQKFTWSYWLFHQSRQFMSLLKNQKSSDSATDNSSTIPTSVWYCKILWNAKKLVHILVHWNFLLLVSRPKKLESSLTHLFFYLQPTFNLSIHSLSLPLNIFKFLPLLTTSAPVTLI